VLPLGGGGGRAPWFFFLFLRRKRHPFLCRASLSCSFPLSFRVSRGRRRQTTETGEEKPLVTNARQAKVEHFFLFREKGREQKSEGASEEEVEVFCETFRRRNSLLLLFHFSLFSRPRTMTLPPTSRFDEQWDVALTLDWLQALVLGRGRRRGGKEEQGKSEGASTTTAPLPSTAANRNRHSSIRRVVLQFPDALLPVSLAVQARLSSGSIARGLDLEVRGPRKRRKRVRADFEKTSQKKRKKN